jgi:5'-3' exonuclease
MDKFGYSREEAEDFLKFKERKIREEDEGFRQFKEKKMREPSSGRSSESSHPRLTPHRSPSSRHKSSSSSSRPYLSDHAKAYRRYDISPEDWKRLWMKPHLNKGKTHEEAVKRAEKELASSVCKIMKSRYMDRGMSGAEAEKKLDKLFSRPALDEEYA